MTSAPLVQERKRILIKEAMLLLESIRELANSDIADPWTDAATLTKAITTGLLDAPQLKNNKYGRGLMRTQIIKGSSQAVDTHGNPLDESTRIKYLLQNA
jgi:hypothetical protein